MEKKKPKNRMVGKGDQIMRNMTLVLLVKEGKILLGMKKKGFGVGLYNGFGGKVKADESVEAAAVRELFEETGIKTEEKYLKKTGELNFSFPHNPVWNQKIHVYTVNRWDGKPIESNEMKPEWFELMEIPLDKMWEADKQWMPLVLNGKNVKASFVYNEKSQVVSSELKCMEPVYITYFVHGTTTDNENEISTGWNQGELSKLGIEQSKKLKSLIGDKKFDVVFCSDLKRSIDSAELAFGKYNLIIRDKRLRECNYGNLNGKKSEIVEPLAEKSITKPFPNGECYKNVEKRIRSFLEFLLKKYPGKHVAIVAHKAPQLALDVIIKKKTWRQAFDEDWRKTKSWKPGWDYVVINNL